MEISDFVLFLRYALPCAETLVKRGWVGRDVVELELEHAAVEGEKPKTDIRDVFPVAYARCSLLAKRMERNAINADVIRAYFWAQHDDVIEERHKEFGDFDKELCKVVAGKVSGTAPLKVETAAGERDCENPYGVDVASGDNVVMHYSRIIEKVSDEQARSILEGKAEEMFKNVMNDVEGKVARDRAFIAEPGTIQVEKPKAEETTGQEKKEKSVAEEPVAEKAPKTKGKKPVKKERLSSEEAAKRPNNHRLGITLALMAACVSGASVFANKLFVADMDPALFTAARALIIGLMFLLLSAASGTLKAKRMPWTWLVLIGVVGGGLAFLMFFSGLKLTTAGRAAFLQKTLPLWVAAMAVPLLKERIGRNQAIAMALMFGGALVIIGAPVQAAAMWLNPAAGDFLVLAATILWAAENVAARKLLREGGSSLVVSFGRMFFGALFLFGVLGLTGNAGALLTLTPTQLTNLMVSTGLLFVYVSLYYWSLKHTDVSKAATALLLAPAITLVLSAQFLGEPLQGLQLTGFAAILVGGFLIARTARGDGGMQGGV